MKIFWLKDIKEKIKNFDIFELGNSVILYFILIFGALSIFTFFHLPSKVIEYIIGQNVAILSRQTVFYLIIGISSFIFGYRFFRVQKISQKLSDVLKTEWSSKKVLWVFSAVFLAALTIKIIRFLGGGYLHLNKSLVLTGSSFYSLIGLLDWLGPIALAIAFVYYFHLFKRNDLNYKFWRFIAWGTFIFEFIYGFFSGSRFSAITPIIIYLIVKQYLYKRNFWRVAVVFVLVLFLIMPLQSFYRNPKIFLNSYSGLVNNQKKIELLGVQQFVVDHSVGRIDQSRILSAVFKKTDKFLYGETLEKFFISLGPPRFIWKNKPVIQPDGNEFGRRVGILAPDDFQTSVGPTIFGDWYINFGIWGIIFGMLFLGGFLRFIFDAFIEYSSASLSGTMIYSVFWISIIKGMEDWIAPVYAGLIKLFVILLVIHFSLAVKKVLKYGDAL